MDEGVGGRRRFLKGAAMAAGGGLLTGSISGAAPAAGAPPMPPGAEPVFDVKRFGAVGDGKADDTGAIQRALDEAGLAGGIVFLPGGKYLAPGNLSVPPSVCLQGVFKSPPRSGVDGGGSILLATAGKGLETGPPFILLHTNSTVRGLAVFYPDQGGPVYPYPPTIQGIGDDCSVVDVLLMNPYYGVDFGTHPCGRHWIKSLYMQAIRRGVYVAECFDVGRIEDVHVWPFWRIGDKKVDAITSHQGEAFVLARTDWEYMINCFCINYAVGYRFTTSASGPGNVVLTQCGSDEGPVSTSVLVEASQGHAGISFVNGQFMGQRHVDVRPTNTGPVKFTACGFWGMNGITGSMARLQGKGQVSFQNCHFTGWAQAGDSQAPAISAENGGLSMVGCDFMDAGKNQVSLASGVEAAAIIGCRLRGGAKIHNSSKGTVETIGNV